MKNINNKALIFVILTTAVIMVIFSITSGGGSLEPPGPPSSTMHTLEQIYDATSSLSLGQLSGPIAAAKARRIAYVDVNNLAIPGESTDSAHTNWIEVFAVYYSAKLPSSATLASVGGRTGSRAEFSGLTIVKELDKASPLLSLNCANGEYLGDVVIEFTAGAAKTVYHRITLKDAKVVSLVPVMSHRSSGEYIHLEEISFEYSEIYWEYTPYNDSGPTGPPVTAGWSVIENMEK